MIWLKDMVKKSKRELYSGVSIPIDTMNEIEEYRKDHPEKKYRSRAEFIIEAIRQKMDKDIAIDALKTFSGSNGRLSSYRSCQFELFQLIFKSID